MTQPPEVDFGRAAADYARHRQGFPPVFFARIAAWGIGQPGQRVLDLGTGTGLLARALAERGCLATGLDPSPDLLAQARAAAPDLTWLAGRAEATGLPGGAFDVVTAATCWHWFDRPAAAAEAMRLLAPGGRLLICSLDWHRVPGGVVDATMAVIRRFSPLPEGAPQGGGVFQYPAWARELLPAGFSAWESFALTLPLSYTPAAWRGRVQASAHVVAMDAATRTAYDAVLADVLSSQFPGSAVVVEHHLFALVAWA
ncbi:MAG: class I SAM-dependent methyltransferase [Acetobacteraceae bacterium]|nr:class I SAM-dependent methyltransferase [Acetobacteraceae bacterium]